MAQLCGKRRFSLQKQSAKWLKIWQIFTFFTCSIAAPPPIETGVGDIRLAVQKGSGYDDCDR
jgi:hypothetical protein